MTDPWLTIGTKYLEMLKTHERRNQIPTRYKINLAINDDSRILILSPFSNKQNFKPNPDGEHAY